MPDLDVIVARFCSSYWGVYEVPSKSEPGRIYQVAIGGGLAEVNCPCRGFEIRSNCSHVKIVERGACLWNDQYYSGNQPVVLTPIDYLYRPDSIPGEKCPNCKADICPVRWAV